MTDIEIRYPGQIDILPFTETVSVNIGDNINAIRDAVLNIETILGLDVNIGLFTTGQDSTVADRLNRIERGIAERNLVWREINVSDAFQVLLNQNNQPSVKLGLGSTTQIAPVTILGPLTILAPQVAEPKTIIQTPVVIDVTTFRSDMSSSCLIKGKSNQQFPLLTITDTNTSPDQDQYALKITGNVFVSGKLTAEYSIDHNKLMNIQTTPTERTRGEILHVTQGNYHCHRKGKYNTDTKSWIVSTTINTDDTGIINHSDLEGIGTLPTHLNEFTPTPGVSYHVTGGDLHSHESGAGAQIDHNSLKNTNPNYSNHVTGGNTHSHTADGDGGQISHNDLSDIQTTGLEAIHVTNGDNHSHGLDEEGNLLGDGAQINHSHLVTSSIDPNTSNHVTGGNAHSHTDDGDGAKIDHNNLSNIGNLTHEEIDSKIQTFRAIKTGTATFTVTNFNEVQVSHSLGTDQFNVGWSINGDNFAPPSDPLDLGVIYVSEKTSSTFKFKRIGGSIPGQAIQAQVTTSLGSNADLKFIAKNPGSDGNLISIEYQSETTGDPILINTTTSGKDYFVEATTNPPTFILHFDVSDPLIATEARAVILQNSSGSTYLTADIADGQTGAGTISNYGPFYLSDGYDQSDFNALTLEWIIVSKD